MGYLWSPPGGGAEYGISVKQQLINEFDEETGLQVDVAEFMFANEYINDPIHAIELFFRVEIISGEFVIVESPMDLSRRFSIVINDAEKNHPLIKAFLDFIEKNNV